ncbi:MAG: efflux RND transporter permease subunit [Armatimonadota bacterium]
MKLPALALRHPLAMLVLTLAVAVLGIVAVWGLRVNLLPDITYPLVKVHIRWTGATPDQLEENIGRQVERNMASLDGLDYLDASYTDGFYTLFVYFHDAVNRDVAYQDVLAKMQLARQQLPADAGEPQVLKADPSQLPVMDLAIASTALTPVQLRTWVEQDLQDRFLAVEGTAGASVAGGLEREIRVHIDPERLQAIRMTLGDIKRRLQEENIEVPGGLVTVGAREFTVRTRARFQSVEDILRLLIRTTPDGRGVRLGDVATVEDAARRQRVITRLNNQEIVRLSVFKQVEANTVEVADRIQRTIVMLKDELPEGTSIAVVYDQSRYIRASVSGVRDAAFIAALLVVLATMLFLHGWQRVVTILLALPLSLLGTFLVMWALDFSLNIFSLGGLVIAITIVLDNCVVVMENITRHQQGEGNEVTTFEMGTQEVAGAVISATVTFLALFLPFLFVKGLVSLLFHELIVTVAAAIAISLVVALTVAPVLMRLLFARGKPPSRSSRMTEFSERLIAGIQQGYRPVLETALRHRWATLWVTLGLFGLGVLLFGRLGSEFLPEMDDGQVTIKLKLPAGTSVEETAQLAERASVYAQELPGVERAYTLVGGRVLGLVTTEFANEGEVNLQLVPRHDRRVTTKQFVERMAPQIQQAVKKPGAQVKVMHTKMKGIRGFGNFDIEVEVYGPASASIEQLVQVARGIAKEVQPTPGLMALDVSVDVSKPEFDIAVDHTRASALGIPASQVAGLVRTLVDGDVTTQYEERGYYYPLRVQAPEALMANRQSLERLPVLTTDQGTIQLGDVAQVTPTVGAVQIDRKDQRRVVKVTAMAVGRSVGEVTREVQRRVLGVQLPSGYQVKYGGQAQGIRQTYTELGIILILALFLAYVVLVVQFENLWMPLLIVLRVPLSLIGMAVALYITSSPIGITVLMGVIIMAGIEINHGVVLLEFVRQRRAQDALPAEAVRDACLTRLRPILMTALVGILGLLPLALGLGEGTEALQPMAIAVMGGLLFSMPLTLLFLPAMYLLLARHSEIPTAGHVVPESTAIER